MEKKGRLHNGLPCGAFASRKGDMSSLWTGTSTLWVIFWKRWELCEKRLRSIHSVMKISLLIGECEDEEITDAFSDYSKSLEKKTKNRRKWYQELFLLESSKCWMKWYLWIRITRTSGRDQIVNCFVAFVDRLHFEHLNLSVFFLFIVYCLLFRM